MNPKSIVKLLQKNLCLQNSYLCTTQSKYTSQRHSSSWKSLTHRVGALEVEVGRLDPLESKEYAPHKRGTHISSVLAVHASGCSYKTWGKLAPLLPCPLLAPNLFGYGRSQPWPPRQDPDIAGFPSYYCAWCCLYHTSEVWCRFGMPPFLGIGYYVTRIFCLQIMRWYSSLKTFYLTCCNHPVLYHAIAVDCRIEI